MISNNTIIKTNRRIFTTSEIWITTACLFIILGGFFIRLEYLISIEFHPDEYISMLAARAVSEHGIPLMPSGLVYNPELVFSYFSGLMMKLMNANELSGRWVGMFFGVLLLPVAYVTVKRMFSSSYAGLAIVTLFAFAPDVVLWGARSRRYAMLQVFILLMLLLIWSGVIQKSYRKHRIFFFTTMLLAGLTGSLSLIIFPPLALTVVLLTWKEYAPKGIPRKGILIEIGIFIIILALLIWQAQHDFVAQTSAYARIAQPVEDQTVSFVERIVTSISPFLLFNINLPGEIKNVQDIINQESLYPVMILPAMLVLVISLVSKVNDAKKLRTAGLFMAGITLGVALEFLFFVSDDWKSSRYLLAPFWTPLAILASGMIGWLEWYIRRWDFIKTKALFNKWPVILFSFSLIVPLNLTLPGTLNYLTYHKQKDNIHYQAVQYVAHFWQPEDEIVTTITMPAMVYWYLGKTDYYARGKSPYIFKNSQKNIVDIWTGALWIYESEDLKQVFENRQTVWMILDEKRLYHQLPLGFKQQVFSRMDKVFQAGDIMVFRSKVTPDPIPFEPETCLESDLNGTVELKGFSLDDAMLFSGKPTQLTLFWKAHQPLFNGKVFVHLRNNDNQTVVQADHFPSEAIAPLLMNSWPVGETVPDVSYFTLPSDIPPGEYRLLVGIYNPQTLERLPVNNDTTGENAVVLKVFNIP